MVRLKYISTSREQQHQAGHKKLTRRKTRRGTKTTNNDYIAQYIKEKHPSLLGFDFCIWRMCRAIGDTVGQIGDILKTIPSDELKKIMEDAEGESDQESDDEEAGRNENSN